MARFRVELVQSVVELRSNHITKTKLVRRPNSELRPREHLTEREINKLIEVAKRNRWGQRDSTMVLMAYRHGLLRPAMVRCGI